MGHRSGSEPFLVRVWIFPAIRGPHAVDLAAVVFAQERTRLLTKLAATLLARCQIRFSKRIGRHVQVLGDPFGIGAGFPQARSGYRMIPYLEGIGHHASDKCCGFGWRNRSGQGPSKQGGRLIWHCRRRLEPLDEVRADEATSRKVGAGYVPSTATPEAVRGLARRMIAQWPSRSTRRFRSMTRVCDGRHSRFRFRPPTPADDGATNGLGAA